MYAKGVHQVHFFMSFYTNLHVCAWGGVLASLPEMFEAQIYPLKPEKF